MDLLEAARARRPSWRSSAACSLAFLRTSYSRRRSAERRAACLRFLVARRDAECGLSLSREAEVDENPGERADGAGDLFDQAASGAEVMPEQRSGRSVDGRWCFDIVA